MSTPEEMRTDAKRDAYHDRVSRLAPDACEGCGADDWNLYGTDPAYGADADGRRGIPLREWECRRCGNLVCT